MGKKRKVKAMAELATGAAGNGATKRGGRLILLDVVRGVALVAMAIYHFVWDLEFFGYVEPGTASTGAWKLFARSIASSFLFLAGFSLVLGHYPTIRWRPFLRRFAMIVAAALAITAATLVAVPGSFIFYGILHAIAVASLAGLLFLRVPPLATALLAVAVIALPQVFRAQAFDTPLLWWTGLAPHQPHSNDFVPFFPWLGATLFGIAAARIAKTKGWLPALGSETPGAATRGLALAGRHSLLVYLIHQPILIALVYLATLAVPAPGGDPAAAYDRNCVASCTASQSEGFCTRFCACTREELERRGLFADLMEGRMNPANDDRARSVADQCTARILGGSG